MFSQIARINDHLYLSSLEALTPARLEAYGVTQIISAMMEKLPADLLEIPSSSSSTLSFSTSTLSSTPSVLADGGRRAHVQICVEDAESADLSAHFDTVADRIAREARRGGRSLVHCVAGVSRSASLVLAYLVKHGRMTLAEAYDHVRAIRPCISPNTGFWRQLVAYEISRRGTPSVRINVIPPDTSSAASRGSKYTPRHHRSEYLHHTTNHYLSRY